jgi:aconitase A
VIPGRAASFDFSLRVKYNLVRRSPCRAMLLCLARSRQGLTVRATKEDGAVITFNVIARLDTPVDVDYYKNGGTAKRADGVEEAGA